MKGRLAAVTLLSMGVCAAGVGLAWMGYSAAFVPSESIRSIGFRFVEDDQFVGCADDAWAWMQLAIACATTLVVIPLLARLALERSAWRRRLVVIAAVSIAGRLVWRMVRNAGSCLSLIEAV